MRGDLEGKLVVVTGGSGDIGREVALAAAEEGARVVSTYNSRRSNSVLLANEARKRGLSITPMKLDVSDEKAVKRFFDRIAVEEGRPSAVINVAGHSSRETWFARLDELDSSKWLEVLKVDLLGTFFCCREASRHMKAGSIVNFSSAAGVTGHTEGLPYTAAKSALIGLTKSLASLLGPGIRVNAVAPGNIDAGSVAWYGKAGRRAMAAEAELKRLGSAREVANLAVFLASEKSSFITGQVLLVDGGI